MPICNFGRLERMSADLEVNEMDIEEFLKSKDFMKLGQAIEHGNWQVAGMTAQRMQKAAREAGTDAFDRQLISIKQCIAGRKKNEAQNALAFMISKRVQMLKNYESKVEGTE